MIARQLGLPHFYFVTLGLRVSYHEMHNPIKYIILCKLFNLNL